LLTGIIAVGAVATVAASSALAATPRQIYADLAQHGKLTHHYSAADLQRAARDATVQGYGGVDTQGSTPVIQAAVAGSQATKERPAQVLGGATTPTGSATLPFTGVQLGVFVALGLALLGGGLLLRRAGRNDASG
jgi:hypothetical protein